MADVKVPALLHKMSKAAQKAWYKKNNMKMPSETDDGGKSAAAAKKVKVEPRKKVAAKPETIRALNAARQKGYYEKGGRSPVGAAGPGGQGAMVGVDQGSAKQIIKGIKAGVNPKVALVRYTNEEVVEEATKKEAEALLGGPVKAKPKMPPGKQPAGYRYVRGLARKAMKKGMKEEVDSVNEDQASDMQKIQSMDKGSMVGSKTELNTHLKYLNAMHTHQKKYGLDTAKTKKKIGDVSRSLVQMGEEAEQVDEANMRFDYEAAARPKSSDVKNFLNRDKNPRAAAASKKYIRRMTKLGGLGPNQTKKDTEAHMKAHFEEVEQIDELNQKTLKSYIKKNVDSKAYEKSPNKDAGLERATTRVARNQATSTLKNKVSKLRYTPMNKHKNPFEYQASRDELGNRKVSEEVELEEGKIAKALAVGAMSLASMGAKAHTDTTKSVAQLAKERPALAQRLQDIGATGQVPASDKRAAELQKKQDQEMPASERRAKELEKMKKEEVVQTDEATKDWKKAFGSVAQKNLQKDIGKMRSKVSRLKYVGADPKVDMSQKVTAQKTQKGIYSEEAQYIEEKLTAADPASKWISDFVASDNPKFAGKSKKERINMALGAYYSATGKGKKNEEAVAIEKKLGEGMDAVGREDKDIDNDGDSDKTDVYLHNKRKAIGNAIRKKLTSKLEKKDGE